MPKQLSAKLLISQNIADSIVWNDGANNTSTKA